MNLRKLLLVEKTIRYIFLHVKCSYDERLQYLQFNEIKMKKSINIGGALIISLGLAGTVNAAGDIYHTT